MVSEVAVSKFAQSELLLTGNLALSHHYLFTLTSRKPVQETLKTIQLPSAESFDTFDQCYAARGAYYSAFYQVFHRLKEVWSRLYHTLSDTVLQ